MCYRYPVSIKDMRLRYMKITIAEIKNLRAYKLSRYKQDFFNSLWFIEYILTGKHVYIYWVVVIFLQGICQSVRLTCSVFLFHTRYNKIAATISGSQIDSNHVGSLSVALASIYIFRVQYNLLINQLIWLCGLYMSTDNWKLKGKGKAAGTTK